MRTKYKVRHIYEDDFGCEEREENSDVKVIVELEDTDGERLSVKQSDAWMYEQEINEGDEAFLIDGKLKKALGEDWTEKCNQSMDVSGFLKLMEQLKSGETTDCPFCGGTVSMTKAEDENYRFACDSCDMYFVVENHSQI